MPKYRYLINVAAVLSSWRLVDMLPTKSVLLLQEGWDHELIMEWLVPWEHYVPISPGLSDLIEKVEWLQRNQDVAESIAERGFQRFRERVRRQDTFCYLWQAFQTLADVQTKASTEELAKHVSDMKEVKSKLISSELWLWKLTIKDFGSYESEWSDGECEAMPLLTSPWSSPTLLEARFSRNSDETPTSWCEARLESLRWKSRFRDARRCTEHIQASSPKFSLPGLRHQIPSPNVQTLGKSECRSYKWSHRPSLVGAQKGCQFGPYINALICLECTIQLFPFFWLETVRIVYVGHNLQRFRNDFKHFMNAMRCSSYSKVK